MFVMHNNNGPCTARCVTPQEPQQLGLFADGLPIHLHAGARWPAQGNILKATYLHTQWTTARCVTPQR